jgi:hypothetical protein
MIQYAPVNDSVSVKVLLTVFPAVVAFVSGAVKIFSIQEKIKSCQTFLTKVDDFNSQLAARQNLPMDLLVDDKKYIQNNMSTYYQICKENNSYDS